MDIIYDFPRNSVDIIYHPLLTIMSINYLQRGRYGITTNQI